MNRFSEVTARCAGFMIDALNEASRSNLGDGGDIAEGAQVQADAADLLQQHAAAGHYSVQ